VPAAYLFAGGSSGLSSTVNAIGYPAVDNNNDFGIAVAAGDVNGDGYSDVLVAADTALVPNGQSCHNGGVFLYDGSSSTARALSVALSQSLGGPLSGCVTTNFGQTLASVSRVSAPASRQNPRCALE
jgi:hypothetical protein